MSHPATRLRILCCLPLLVAACGTDSATSPDTVDAGGGADSGGADSGRPVGPAIPVTETEPVPAALQQALSQAATMTASELQSTYAAPPASLDYDPSTAAGLDLIQASALALNASDLARLHSSGVVIAREQQFPSFAYGYKTLYAEDLPLYVSADSLLEAVHRTFDAALAATETTLAERLGSLLQSMRGRIAGRFEAPQVARDLDLYLTVAESLLSGRTESVVGDASQSDVASLVDKATAASGHEGVELFGVPRDVDFSQFEPRGHYTDSEALTRYFKAMMWLGRVDLRLIETQGDGSQVFYRRQFEAAAAMRELLGEAELESWELIDGTIGAYVGEHDSMTPKDVAGLMEALGVTSLAEASALTDEAIVEEIRRGGWGAQRIASRIIIKGNPSAKTLPLDRSFLLFGQRYTVDSHTFANVTFDRVAGRMRPEPLDAAFAALGNDAALSRLADEFDNGGYVQALGTTRALVDAHEPGYWEGSLYTRWLGALRTLSPGPSEGGVADTSAWQARALGTQLASWSELRHDTILYVKQSYTGGAVCEFPDAYVDPYPELYAKLGQFADALGAVAEDVPPVGLEQAVRDWVANFKLVMSNLELMAENQIAGVPHSPELMAFINDAVSWDEMMICGAVEYSNLNGWYLRTYLNPYAGLEYDPVVADVHTQPTDEGGADVGRILHVGTGMPRLMVVTANTCQGPRAYAGLAFSYGEHVTEDWVRLNDNDWRLHINTEPFPDPPFMSEVFGE